MSDPLTGTTWHLVGPIDIPDGIDAVVTFDDGTVGGFAGCNRFRGTYEADDGTIRIGPMLSTRMFCSEEAMAVESELLDALPTVRSYSMSATMLVLICDDEHTLIFTLSQQSGVTRLGGPRHGRR